MRNTDSTNPYETSTLPTSAPLADKIAAPATWWMHLALLVSAFVSWVTLIFAIVLEMRNMFGGPPPDRIGIIFIALSMLFGTGGICYFASSKLRRLEATRTSVQKLALVILLLANALPPGQIALAILS